MLRHDTAMRMSYFFVVNRFLYLSHTNTYLKRCICTTLLVNKTLIGSLVSLICSIWTIKRKLFVNYDDTKNNNGILFSFDSISDAIQNTHKRNYTSTSAKMHHEDANKYRYIRRNKRTERIERKNDNEISL